DRRSFDNESLHRVFLLCGIMRAYLIRLRKRFTCNDAVVGIMRLGGSSNSAFRRVVGSLHNSARTSMGVVPIASALQLGELRIDQRRKRVSAAGRDRDSDMFGKVMERAPGLI